VAGLSVEGVSLADELLGDPNGGAPGERGASGFVDGRHDGAGGAKEESKLARWRGQMSARNAGAERAWDQGERAVLQDAHCGSDARFGRRPSGGSGSELADSAVSSSCAGGDGGARRAAKLADWRRSRRSSAATHCSDERRGSEAAPTHAGRGVEQGESSRFVDGALADGERKEDAAARRTLWRHLLPDLKEMGFDFHFGPGPRMVLFVLRVFVRMPAVCAGGVGHGVSNAPQIVEIFTNIL
jgi:hypothetical protein